MSHPIKGKVNIKFFSYQSEINKPTTMLMHFSTGVSIEVDSDSNALIFQVSDLEDVDVEKMRNLFNEESVARIKKLGFLLVISVDSLQTMRNLFLTFPFIANNVGIVIDQAPQALINSLLIVFNKKWTLYPGAMEIEAILAYVASLVKDPKFYGTGPPGPPGPGPKGPGGSAGAAMILVSRDYLDKLHTHKVNYKCKYAQAKKKGKKARLELASSEKAREELVVDNGRLKKNWSKCRVQLFRARRDRNKISLGDVQSHNNMKLSSGDRKN